MSENVGLTGGIGCGKSTVLRAFRERGLETLDTDAVVRDLLASDTATIEAVRQVFGDKVLEASGRVDRSRLGGIVFKDSQALRDLEGILHPRVREVWSKAVAENDGVLIVEIPLLFEKGLESSFDWTLCLACSEPVQRQRLRDRGMSDTQINQRKEKQLPLETKMARADVVIFNDGSLTHLLAQVDHLCRERGWR